MPYFERPRPGFKQPWPWQLWRWITRRPQGARLTDKELLASYGNAKWDDDPESYGHYAQEVLVNERRPPADAATEKAIAYMQAQVDERDLEIWKLRNDIRTLDAFKNCPACNFNWAPLAVMADMRNEKQAALEAAQAEVERWRTTSENVGDKTMEGLELQAYLRGRFQEEVYIKRIVQERDAAQDQSKRIAETFKKVLPEPYFCEECGTYFIGVDEDECCVTCGAQLDTMPFDDAPTA